MNKKKELLKIASEIEKCSMCKRWGKGKAVPGEGNPDARVVLVGEAPGREESETGRPFVGRSGRLLRSLIREMGMDEEEVFITSPVKYLPVRGTPSIENIAHSRAHLMSQLSVIEPEIVVLLGSTACQALLGRRVHVTEKHGSIIRKGGRMYFVTLHPAYALRFPEGKSALIRDFKKLKKLVCRVAKD